MSQSLEQISQKARATRLTAKSEFQEFAKVSTENLKSEYKRIRRSLAELDAQIESRINQHQEEITRHQARSRRVLIALTILTLINLGLIALPYLLPLL